MTDYNTPSCVVCGVKGTTKMPLHKITDRGKPTDIWVCARHRDSWITERVYPHVQLITESHAWPDDSVMTFRIAIRCTGKKPTLKDEAME